MAAEEIRRVVAVCRGGPLDGQTFSVPLNDNGDPEPMFSRADVVGVLYVPEKKIGLSIEMQAEFAEAELRDGEIVIARQIPHEGAWQFKPASDDESAALMAAHKAKFPDPPEE